MTTFKTASGQIDISDHQMVQQMANYSAVAILKGDAVIIDATNIAARTADEPMLPITKAATAHSLGVCGIATENIAAVDANGIPGIGSVCTNGPCRGKSASIAFTLGQIVATAASAAGEVYVDSTAGCIIGKIMKAETTTTPLIWVNVGH